MKSLLLLIQLILLPSLTHSQAISASCASGEATLSDDTELTEATLLMGAGYPETPLPADPIRVNTTLNWGGTNSMNMYNRMKNQCESSTGHTLCTVRTEVKFQQEVGGQEAINYVTEESKPVCMPPTCSDDEIAIIEPEPGRCNPNNPIIECEVLSYELTCPNDRTVSQGACAQTLNGLTSPYFVARNAIETRVRAACPQNLAVSGSSNLCVTEVGTLEVRSIRDYSGKEQDEVYHDYVKECLNSQGKVCEAVMTVKQRAEREGLGEFFFMRTYFQQPLCMATTCGGDDETRVVKQRFADTFSGVPCNLDDGSCLIDVASVDCSGVTVKPTSLSERQPTVSPTVQVISDVCREGNQDLLPALATSFATLSANFPDEVNSQDPLVVETVQRWDQINSNIVYTQMKSACEQKTGHVMCKAITKVEFSEQIAGFEANNTITERNKPVCYPPTCSGRDDFLTLEPNPGLCNPDVLPCKIVDYAVKCPAVVTRPVPTNFTDATDATTCESTMDLLTDPFFLARNVLEGRIQTSCLSGGNGRFCTVNYDDMMRVSTRDYEGYENNAAYQQYEEDCLSNGGQVCHADLSMTNRGETVDSLVGLSITSFRNLLGFPMCLSLSCTTIPELQESLKRSIPGCDVTDGSCDVVVAKMECDGGRPTVSPAPTLSPTVSAVSNQCAKAQDTVGETVLATNAALTAKYPDQPQAMDPVEIKTTQNWHLLKDRPVYKRIVQDCDNKLGYTVCTVDSVIRFQQSVGEAEAVNTITELNKPLCVPSTCRDDQVAIVDPTPGRCTGVLPCEVTRQTITCPATRQVEEGTCQSPSPLDTFLIGRNVLSGQMEADCAAGGDKLCELRSSDVVAVSVRDYAGWEEDAVYRAYEAKCLDEARGRVCRVDMTVRTSSPAIEGNLGLAVSVRRERLDMPVCVAMDCRGEDAVAAVIKDRVLGCGQGAAECAVELRRVACDGPRAPTKSPSPTTAPLVSPKCRAAQNELRSAVRTDYLTVLAQFPDVPSADTPAEWNLELHWQELRDTNFWDRMETGCANRGDGHVVCTVTAQTEAEMSLDGVVGATRKVSEESRPVCFSKDCREDQLNDLEPNLMNAEIDCPDDRPINPDNSSTTCDPVTIATEGFNFNRALLESRLYANCAVTALEEGDDLCTMDTEDISVRSSADFSTAPDLESYQTLDRECTAQSGRMCRVDMVVRTGLPAAATQVVEFVPKVEYERTFLSYPICVTNRCRGRTEIELLVQERLPVCEATPECDVTIQKLSCDGTPLSSSAPTRAPVQTTEPTTMSTMEFGVTSGATQAPTGNTYTTTTTTTTPGETSNLIADPDASSAWSLRYYYGGTLATTILVGLLMPGAW